MRSCENPLERRETASSAWFSSIDWDAVALRVRPVGIDVAGGLEPMTAMLERSPSRLDVTCAHSCCRRPRTHAACDSSGTSSDASSRLMASHAYKRSSSCSVVPGAPVTDMLRVKPAQKACMLLALQMLT